MNRLFPENKGNARLLYIDEDNVCDICDNKSIGAVIDCLGGRITIHICRECLKELLKLCEENV